ADLLHDAALAYYRAAADADPTQRILLTCEATYHDFQRHGAAAGGRWRAAIDAPALRRDPAARLALAEEVTGTAYVDDDGEPREWGVGQPLIDPADLAYAHAHRARAHLDLTRRESGDAEWHWKEVGGALGHHDRLAGRHPGATAPPATLAPVRAAGLAHRGDTGGALDALAPASEALDLADLIAGWRMRGDLLRDQVRPDLAGAADSYRTALELMARAPERFLPADRFEIREFLARVELDRDRMAEALAACPDSIEVARFLPNDRIGQSELLTGGELARNRMAEGSWVDPALGVRLVLLRRTILLRSGRPQRALSEPIPEAIGFLARLGDWNGADAEAELDLLNFREAQYHLEPFFRDPESARSRMGPETAMAFDIDSRIAFSLFQFHRAIHRLAEAHRQWAEMRRYDYANRALARLVAARLHDLGDLGAARAELGEWSSDTQDDSPGEADIELEMLRAECLDRGGAGDEARRLVERRLAQARSSGPPRMIVRVALQGLLLREGSIDAFLDALGEALHAITPRSARAARLEPLQRCTRSE
ncbi:MAG TPA: hypothetical protein VF590_09435, partial [Isosphaeraceae bacterium]